VISLHFSVSKRKLENVLLDLFGLIEEKDLQNLLLDTGNPQSYLKTAFIATNTETSEARESFLFF
jgi:hypothetical protein